VTLIGDTAVGIHCHSELGERGSQSNIMRLDNMSGREIATRQTTAHHQDHGAAFEKAALEAFIRDPDRGVDVLFSRSSGETWTQLRWD
jgi:predicted NAD/FAD-dependent oxidoreductase